tara:strand:- start:1105 stop:1461 length:357 start_codon:yes stop_codon:yes gene_type:complete
VIFTNRGKTTSLLFGRSKRRRARRQARKDAAFAKFRSGLSKKFNKQFMASQERRRQFMMGGVVAQYRQGQTEADRADFDIKSRQAAADRLAEQMLTESRESYRPRKQSLGMLRVPRRM